MVSRFLIAFFFIIFGFLNFQSRNAIIAVMREKRIHFAGLIFYFGVIYQMIFGIAILADVYTTFAAICLIIFDLIAIFIFHPFWTMTGELRRLNKIIFITNSSIVIGALLALIDWTVFYEGLLWLRSVNLAHYPHS